MSAPVDREQLRSNLSDALSTIQRDCDVTGLDALAAALTTLGGPYAFHGRLLQKGLAATPRSYTALIWSLVQRRVASSGRPGPRTTKPADRGVPRPDRPA